MRRFELNKLVRDGVFDSMLENGQQPESRILTGLEKLKALKDKDLEETNEFDPEHPTLGELADRLEVLEETAKEMGASFEQLRAAQLTKRQKVGGFERGIYVGVLALQDDDPWVEYYASDPERFKETQ